MTYIVVWGSLSLRSSFGQIRNCSGYVGVVDQLEAAFTTGLTGLGVRSVIGICGERLDCFRRWKLQQGYKGGIQRLAFQGLHVPAARQVLAAASGRCCSISAK